MDRLTHVDDRGAARMVDVSAKEPTARTTMAGGVLLIALTLLCLLASPVHARPERLRVGYFRVTPSMHTYSWEPRYAQRVSGSPPASFRTSANPGPKRRR